MSRAGHTTTNRCPDRPRNLWILNHYAAKPGESTGTRHFDLAVELRRHGWRTTIFAASHTHLCPPRPVPANHLWAEEEVEGVRFVWVRTSPVADSVRRRILNELTYAKECLTVSAVRPQPAVLLGSSVHLFAGLAAWRLSRIHGVPFVFEVRDLWPETLVHLASFSRRHPAVLVLRALECFLYRRAARVIALMPGAIDHIANSGGAAGRVLYLPNGISLRGTANAGPESDAAKQVLRSLHDSGHFVVVYAGAHSASNAVDVLLRSADRIRAAAQDNIAFVLIGDGRDKPALRSFAAERDLQNVTFLPPIPKSELVGVLSLADACFMGEPRSQLYRFGVSPNKLGPYLAAARPVLNSSSCPYDWVEQAGCGLSVPGEEPARLAEAIVKLSRMTAAQRACLGQHGRRYAEEHLATERLAARLDEALRELL